MKCSLPHQEWGGDAWRELLHSCRNQGVLVAEALGVQEEEKGSDCWVNIALLGIGACRCRADGHSSRWVFLEQAVLSHSEYPCVSSWLEEVP